MHKNSWLGYSTYVLAKYRLFIVQGFLLLFGGSALFLFTQKPLWEGQFTIVLSEDKGISTVQKLVESNPMMASLSGLSSAGSQNSLQTQVLILKSPSVLMPVYRYANKFRQEHGIEPYNHFDLWSKNVRVGIAKGTSVLTVSYFSNVKNEIIPIVKMLSDEYQDYSGRQRDKSLSKSIIYLDSSINRFRELSRESMRAADSFALEYDLVPDLGAKNSLSTTPRQALQLEANLLKRQLVEIKASESKGILLALQSTENEYLKSEFHKLEAKLNYLKSRFKASDELVRSVEREHYTLSQTLINQARLGLEGKLIAIESKIKNLKRPNHILVKYKELQRKALRDEEILSDLETRLQLYKLDQAKEIMPWELISTASISSRPVGPGLLFMLTCCICFSLIGSLSATLALDWSLKSGDMSRFFSLLLPNSTIESLAIDQLVSRRLPVGNIWTIGVDRLSRDRLADSISLSESYYDIEPLNYFSNLDDHSYVLFSATSYYSYLLLICLRVSYIIRQRRMPRLKLTLLE